MYRRHDAVLGNLLLTISLIAAILIAFGMSASGGPGTPNGRAIAFAMASWYLCFELVIIVIHCVRFGWDGLSISMSMARLSLTAYFASMALNMSDLVDVPDWWWEPSRLSIALSCAVATCFLIREAAFMYRDLTKGGRAIMLTSIVLLVATVVVVIIAF